MRWNRIFAGLALASGAVGFASPGFAQNAPDGFSVMSSPMGQAYISPTYPDIQFFLRDLPADHTTAQANAAIRLAKSELLAAGLCPELADDEPQSQMGGAAVGLEDPAPTSLCGAMSFSGQGGLVVVSSSNPEQDSDKEMAAVLLGMSLLGSYNQSPWDLGRTASAPAAPIPSTPAPTTRQAVTPPPDSPTRTGDVEADLKSALAALPSAHRPIGFRIHGYNSMIGFPPVPVYYTDVQLLFPDGFMTDCDLATFRSFDSAAGATAQLEDCDIWRWRRRASGGYEMLEDAEEGWEAITPNLLRNARGAEAFSPGQRLDIRFGNVSGVGFDLGPGSTTTLSISNGGFYMDRQGNILSDRETSTNISGPTVVGGVGNGTVKLSGRYRVDGYLAAVATRSGEIAIVSIIPVDDDDDGTLDHVYFDGEHFWDRSDY